MPPRIGQPVPILLSCSRFYRLTRQDGNQGKAASHEKPEPSETSESKRLFITASFPYFATTPWVRTRLINAIKSPERSVPLPLAPPFAASTPVLYIFIISWSSHVCCREWRGDCRENTPNQADRVGQVRTWRIHVLSFSSVIIASIF